MTDPTSEQWLDLHEAFRDYCQAAPWQWLDDSDLVVIEHPSGEYQGYCVVMGGGGIEYGLALYLGDEGLAGYLAVMSETVDSETPDVLESMNAVTALLADREDLTQRDRDIIRSLGLRYRGRGRWPVFRRAKPGYAPWQLESDEAVFMAMALRNVVDVAARVGGETLDLHPEDHPELILTLVLANGEWQDRWDPFTLPQPPAVPDYPDAERLQKLAESKPGSSTVWEFGIFHIHTPIRAEKGDRPYLPVMAVIVERESGTMLPQNFFGANPSTGQRQQLLVTLLEMLPMLPSVIVVDTYRAADLVESITSRLGVQLGVGETPEVYEVRQELLEFF